MLEGLLRKLGTVETLAAWLMKKTFKNLKKLLTKKKNDDIV
jgi:hypothetical protein